MKANKIKKLILILFLLIVLTACGVNIDESMNIDKKFSGTREMVLSFDKETIDNVEGGTDGIIKLLKENIKEPLKLILLETREDSLSFKLNLDFSSMDDYIRKVNKLNDLGNVDEKVELIFSVSNDDFNKGIEYKDNIDSKNLLKFLVDKAISEGLISENNRSSVWKDHTFKLIYEDEILMEGENPPYEYNDSLYIGPEEIVMMTSRNDNHINRTYNFIFTKENEKLLKENWMNSIFSDSDIEYVGRYEKTYNGVCYVFHKFTISGDSEDIKKANADIFDTENSFSFVEENNIDTFSRDLKISEQLPHNRFSDRASIYSFYYKDEKDIKDHFTGTYMESRKKLFDMCFIADESDLENIYTINKKEKVKFSTLTIETNVSYKGLSRSLSFEKKDNETKKNVEDFLLKYLQKNNIDYMDKENKIIVKYPKNDFKKINSLFFDGDISFDISNKNIIKCVISYTEDSTLSKFEVKRIKQDISFDKFTNIDNSSIVSGENSINNSIKLRETKILNIILMVIFLFILLTLSILIYEKKERKIIDKVKDIKKVEEDDENINNTES